MVKGRNGLKKGCNYVKESEKPLNLRDSYMKFRVKCLGAIRNNDDVTSKTLARAWLTAADLIDRADMKQKQDDHYKKHFYLREVSIIPSEKFSKDSLKFDIILCPAKKSIPKKDKKSIIKEEISSEYKSVENYLNECKIAIKYWWKEAKGKPFYPA